MNSETKEQNLTAPLIAFWTDLVFSWLACFLGWYSRRVENVPLQGMSWDDGQDPFCLWGGDFKSA